MKTLALVVTLLLAISRLSAAQVDVAAGLPGFGTRIDGIVDHLDIASSNIHIDIPVRAKAGKIPFVFHLIGDSHAFIVPVSRVYNGWHVRHGLSGSAGIASQVGANRSVSSTCNGFNDTTYSQAGISDPNGTWHPLPSSFSYDGRGCVTPPSSATTTDGSGYTVVTTTSPWTVYDRAGNSYTVNNTGTLTTMTDPDGFTITKSDSFSIFTYADSLTTTAMTVNCGYLCGNLYSDTYTYTDASGATQTFTVSYTYYSTATAFACSGMLELSGAGYFPTRITLPDNSFYSISYEPTPNKSGYITGRIAAITLPQGGSVAYAYSDTTGNNGINCTSGVVPTLTRTVTDNNGNAGTWTYVNSNNNSGTGNFTVTETDPAGNQAVYSFSGYSVNNQTTYNTNGEFQTQALYYQGTASGTPLKSVLTCWNGNVTTCAAPSTIPTYPITQKSVYTVFNSSNYAGASIRTQYFDQTYGAQTQEDDYDWNQVGVRTTITPLGSWNGSSCAPVGGNVNDRVCYIKVVPYGGTTPAALTYLSYDGKGHLLSSQQLVTGSTYLTSTATYNANGTLATATDPKGTITTYSSYDCNGVLPHTVSVGGISTTYAHDCNGGAITSITDPNNQVTTIDYVGSAADPLWRPKRIVDQLSNTTVVNYTPTTSEASMTFNTGASMSESFTTVDGLSRVINSQVQRGPGSTQYDTASQAYDATGRLSTSSVPCQSGLGALCSFAGAATQTYDGLNRPLVTTSSAGGTIANSYSNGDVLTTLGPAPTNENNKKKQYEYDGLGRLTSVCEITSATGSGSCGQRTAATGFVTSYTYNIVGKVTKITQGSQTRAYTYDDLSRVLSETNPESGTTSYFYDSATGCSSSKGDLVKKVDAVGNVSCFNYDTIHRVTSITYSGPYATNTPAKYFVYGPVTVNGLAMSNPKGRLTEAYTGSSTSKITDLGFSYTARGELATVFESTPNSGGYYTVSTGYWANGVLNTLSGLGLPTLTYGGDNMGRINTVSASSGQNPVTATQYDLRSNATNVTLGSGDIAAFGFDSNTGRMTSYAETINGSTVSGTLHWNSNDSLQRLTITDPFNAADVQTCTFLHDDLARIGNKPGDTTNQSVDCGSTIWQQKFTYDRYGNITKSGSLNWQPGYSATTNRYTLAGTSYDADGNLLNDTFNTYSWDVDGHPITVGANTLTYDALGRQVEKTTGTSHTQKVYALGKMLALMNGQSLSKAWVPLPGGAAAVYNPSISRYLVPDWQGSYRIGSTTTRTYGFSVAFGPFGERYSLSGSPSDFTFAGNNNDTVTNEYDAVNRKEHSSQGRWISPDPVVGNLGDPQSFNKYAYVRNSPLTLVDPSGLAQTGETVKSYLLDDLADLPDAPSATEQGKHNLQDFQNLQMGGPGVSVAANFSFNASNPWGQSSFTGQWVGYGMAQAFGAGSGLRNGDVPADAKAQVVFQGNRQLWNSAATWGNAAFAATGAAIAAPFAAPAIASTGGAILNRLAFGASAGRVFYSGYGAWATASTAAGTYGLSVIETTPVGRLLGLIENAGTSLGLEAQEIGTMLDPIWKSASGLYAGGASGPVLAYQSWSLSAISTWGTVEYGALANNGASIIYLSTGW